MDSFPPAQPEPTVVAEKPERTQRIHVDVHGLPLAIVGTVALVFGLQTAQKFLIPLIFGIFLTYTLNPLVNWLERIRIGRFVATCVVMLALLGAIGGGASTLADEFQSIMQSLPEASHKISRALLLVQTGGPSAMQRMPTRSHRPRPAPEPCHAPWCPRRPGSASTSCCWPVRWVPQACSARPSSCCFWCSFCCCPAIPSSASWSS
jgi:hypothetical protein